MNKGLRLYDGDAVGFLNSDDTFHDEFALLRIAEALRTSDVVFGDLNMVTDHNSKTTKRIWQPGPFRPYAFQLGWAAPHPTFYVRRAVAETVGEFETKYKLAVTTNFKTISLEQLSKYRKVYTISTASP
jgi:glycosyltransferase